MLDETQVLWRDDGNSPWYLLSEEKTSVLFEDGKFFVRASVDHFSQGCLGKNIDTTSTYHQEVGSGFWGSPKKGELEFVNATSKRLMFIVLPTSISNNAFHTFEGGVGMAQAEAHLTIRRSVHQSVLPGAINPQVIQVPPRTITSVPQPGEKCPYATCQLSSWTGKEARVVLATVNDALVSVWDSRIVKQRTRVMVLPRLFDEGMTPAFGEHRTDGVNNSCVSVAISATDIHVEAAPLSTVTAR